MSTTKNFEEIKKDVQTAYAQMSDEDKAVYWEQSVYHVYKDKQLPTSASDKMIFEKLQEIMEIKVTDDISQQVHNLMFLSLKSRQHAVYDIYRKEARAKIAKNNGENKDNQDLTNNQTKLRKVLTSRSNDIA